MLNPDQRNVVQNEEILTLLEELLSVTESLKPKMDHEQRTTWERAAARCADLRDGEDV